MTFQIWRKDEKIATIEAETEQQAATAFVRRTSRSLIASKVPGSSCSYCAYAARKHGGIGKSMDIVVDQFRVVE